MTPQSLRSLRSASLGAAALTFTLLTTGCGLGTLSTAAGDHDAVTAYTISGTLHGGQTPISGATVSLYSVGTTGYGSGNSSNLLATTTSGLSGTFSFTQSSTAPTSVGSTYKCPSATTLIYLTSTGGDPTGTSLTASNSAIKFIEALGPCGSAGSLALAVNEVATVVTLAALQQYISPINETIGSPSTTPSTASQAAATTGLANAFAIVPNLLNLSTGFVNPSYTLSSSTGTVVVTPELGKINTIANIIASCVNTTNSSSGTCTALFAAAVQPNVPAATNFATSYNPAINTSDTLQAALFMLQNPNDAGTQVTTCNGTASTSNISCLFSLTTPTAPFITGTSSLSTQPTDWTISLSYASSTSTTVSTVAVPTLGYAENLAIDNQGNIWIANNVTSSSTSSNLGASVTELSPVGLPTKQILNSGQLYGPGGLAFDPSGNLYVPNFGTTTKTSPYGYGTTVAKYTTTGTASSIAVGGCPFGVTSDAAGDIFVGECSVAVANTSTGNGTPGSDVRIIPASGTTSYPFSATQTTYAADAYSAIATDINGNVYVTSDGAAGLFEFSAPVGTTVGQTTTYVSTSTASTTATAPASLSIDSANNAWVGNYTAPGTLYKYSVAGSPAALTSVAYTGAGLSKVGYSATDGSGNTWITDQATSAGSISEFSNTGAALSPSVGYLHQFYYPDGIAIDPSGNVWIGTEASSSRAAAAASGSLSGVATGGYVTEILGAAVPVITPIAAGLTQSAATATATINATSGIGSITVTAGGTGYVVAPTVTISAPNAGTLVQQATATATVTKGVVTGITITANGTGYTSATVTIAAPTGSALGTTPQ